MKRSSGKSHCPVNFTLELFGDPWSLLIVRDIVFNNKRRFKDFIDSEEGIATNVLVDRLEKLRQGGIIEKMCEQYLITEKGLDLIPILAEMVAWGVKYDPETAAPRHLAALARSNAPQFRREIKKMAMRTADQRSSNLPKAAPFGRDPLAGVAGRDRVRGSRGRLLNIEPLLPGESRTTKNRPLRARPDL